MRTIILDYIEGHMYEVHTVHSSCKSFKTGTLSGSCPFTSTPSLTCSNVVVVVVDLVD